MYKAKKIKVIFTDFDGVWTDNMVWTDSKGVESVRCSKEDSLGLGLFRKKSSIAIIVISKEKNPVVKMRCKKLKLPVLQKIDNKVNAIEKYLKRKKLTWGNVCYIGNDINDLPAIKRAGLSFCPSDANTKVKKQVSKILKKKGGEGAICSESFSSDIFKKWILF